MQKGARPGSWMSWEQSGLMDWFPRGSLGEIKVFSGAELAKTMGSNGISLEFSALAQTAVAEQAQWWIIGQ